MFRPFLARNYFKQEASFWRDVYLSATPEGAIYRTRQEKALEFVDAAALPPGSRVLELGCGAGYNSVELARRGFRLETTDIVEEMVKMARDRLAARDLSAHAHASCCDGEALPFPDNAFDLVIGIAILEWVRSPRQTLAETARVLRPGGYAILSATSIWGLNRLLDPRLSPLLDSCKRWMRRHLEPLQRTARARAQSRSEVDQLVRTAGLTKLQSLTAGYGPFTFLKRKLFPGAGGQRIHEVLQSYADRGMPLLRHCGYTYLMIARKPAATPTRRTDPAAPRDTAQLTTSR
jgi:ubiquinone/menaquinone biosynthesis C-methylase UbiE